MYIALISLIWKKKVKELRIFPVFLGKANIHPSCKMKVHFDRKMPANHYTIDNRIRKSPFCNT